MNHTRSIGRFIEVIQQRLDALGDGRAVLDVEEDSRLSGSSFSIKRLVVRLSDNTELRLVFKDLNPFRAFSEARLIRELSLERSRREVRVYRDLLPSLDLATPNLFSWRWNPSQGELWIILEDVGSKRLSRLGDFEIWCEAARWLGRMHANTSRMPLQEGEANGFLVNYCDQARQRIELLHAHVGRLNRNQRETVAQGFELLSARERGLDQLPVVLVHGEFFGKNVVIRPEGRGEQIAVIDWETAGVGSGMVDLVSISAGRWTSDQRYRMWRDYCDAWCGAGGARELDTLLHEAASATALQQALAWLGWWIEGDDTHIERWVKEVGVALDLARQP